MDFNLSCDNFKNNLYKLINQSDLPLAVIYYIYKDVFNQIQKTYIGAINSAILQKQKEGIQNFNQTVKQVQESNSKALESLELYNGQDKDK